MDESKTAKKPRAAGKVVSTVALRVKRETKKRLLVELARVNKKAFGRKVRIDDLLLCALGYVTDADISALQESSLSNADRLEALYREHIKMHGPMSKDEFIGLVLGSKRVDTGSATSSPL